MSEADDKEQNLMREQGKAEWRTFVISRGRELKPDDFKEPFTSALPEIGQLGLELISMKSIKQYLKNPTFGIVNKDPTEKLEYSRNMVAAVYPWMYHVLHGGLSNSRTEDEKQIIIDQYFHRLQKYAFDHSDFKSFMIFTEVVVQKCL